MVRTQVLTCLLSMLIIVGPACRPGAVETPAFDEQRAFSHLEAQVAFGPRVPGSDAHDRAREWIAGSFRKYTPHVSLQTFTGVFGGSEASMQNILCSFAPEKGDRVLLCAHWDSRHHADRDPDPSKHTLPVPGANDGASGVAVLLEIAAAFAAEPPPVGVDIVLFDGEDGGEYSNNDTWLLGSRHFARVMPPAYQPRYAVLLDMIGDRNLGLTSDQLSMNAAPSLWARIKNLCGAEGISISSEPMGIVDDHVPLIERGIPAVDLIDFDYDSWHTTADTPDKCSAESLGKIGRVVLTLVYGEK